jgi:periplasmic protein TonB
MKTFPKALNKAVNAENLEDIIFENRNHEYGAYALRRNYNNRLNLSLLVIISLASLVVLITYINTIKTPPEIKPNLNGGTIIVISKPEDLEKYLHPQVPKVELPKALIDISKYAPLIVDDTTDNDQLAINQDFGFVKFDGDPNIDLSHIDYIDTSGSLDSAIDNSNTVIYNPTQIQEQALFRGKPVEDFRNWLAENLIYPETASQADISGTVFVNFTVGKNGKLRNIVIQRSIHPLIDKAVVNAIANSPDDWRAARINGYPVNVSYTIPIKFNLQR